MTRAHWYAVLREVLIAIERRFRRLLFPPRPGDEGSATAHQLSDDDRAVIF